jgi:hypothetical protein
MSQSVKIKKHRNRNEYIVTSGGVWVRNLCKPNVTPIDVNKLYTENEYSYILNNELKNKRFKFTDFHRKQYLNIVVLSDGYDFKNKQEILAQLPFKDVAIFATNGALREWKLVGKNASVTRSINWFVVNNPYSECKKFLPIHHSYFPPCLASSRTSTDFIQEYKGDVVLYQPAINDYYSGCLNSGEGIIDDYRNPICAAISFAYCCKVRKLLLFCCDNSFKDERPAAEKLENNLWCYPQQKFSQQIIDANLFWLKKAGVKVADCSSGIKYNNATYIKVEEVVNFFNKE